MRMFRNPFGIKGRIRRLEYGLTMLIVGLVLAILMGLLSAIAESGSGGATAIILSLIQLVGSWLLITQGVKRCHDMNRSGWWVIVPIFPLWLLFCEGTKGENFYGEDPKA